MAWPRCSNSGVALAGENGSGWTGDPAVGTEPVAMEPVADSPRSGVDRSADRIGVPGPYAIQARIAACHATAATFAETDWNRIVALYDALLTTLPTPVVALNRAVAVGMAQARRRDSMRRGDRGRRRSSGVLPASGRAR